jgi:hypothetical protein
VSDADTRWPGRVGTAIIVLLVLATVGAAVASFVPISGTITVESNSGTTVSVSGASELETNNVFVDDETLRIETNDGVAEFSSPGDTNATVASADLEGQSTAVTNIDASAATLTIDPADKPGVDVSGGIDSVTFREMAIDDGTTDFAYTASSSATITVRGLASDASVSAVDSGGTVLGGATTDGTGAVTFSLPSGSYSSVTIQSNQAPSVSSMTPSSNLEQAPTNVTATISDDSLPAESVNVSVSIDGSEIGTTTATSDGETIDVPITQTLTGGDHTVTVNATDSSGATASETETFSVPSTLEIRNESAPSELVNGTGVTVEVTFFGDDQTYQRTTTDGTVNLTGLPVGGQPFIIQVEADGYVQRRAVIEDIYQQNTVYLLPDSVTRVQTRFVLEDNTGQFDSSTTRLYISKAINDSGTIEYKTVAADTFGPGGFTTELEKDQRYQLRVVNEDGDSRALGAYQATLNETVTLTVGELSFPVSAEDTYRVDGGANTNSNDVPQSVFFEYGDPDSLTDSLDLTIHERYNASNQLYTEDIAPVSGNISRTVMLTGDQQNTTWVADYEIERGGETVTGTLPLTGQRFGAGLPLESGLLAIFSTGLLLLLGGLFSRANAAVGALIIPLAAGALWVIDLVPPEVSGASIVLAFAVAALYRIAISGQGGIPT